MANSSAAHQQPEAQANSRSQLVSFVFLSLGGTSLAHVSPNLFVARTLFLIAHSRAIGVFFHVVSL
jgi:hypothetical protein